MNILVIDDDASLRRTLRTSLEVLGHRAVEARDSAQALELLGRRPFEMALLDLRLAQEQGLDLLPRLLGLGPRPSCGDRHGLCHHRNGGRGHAARGLRLSAQAVHARSASRVLDRIAHMRRLQSQVDELEEQVRSVVPEVDLQTSEPTMREALDVAFKTAASEATILLRGESGTGKGVLARAIHARSPRAAGPFVTVHCPSLSAELLESELFGHVAGRFHRARCGTRWARWPPPKAARCSSTKSATCRWPCSRSSCGCSRNGATSGSARTQTRASNVRILAATNRNLEAEIAAGRFREDLFYRLNVIEVTAAAAARAAGRHPAVWRSTCCGSSPGRTASRSRGLPSRCAMPCSATPGPATSANCATPSSGA